MNDLLPNLDVLDELSDLSATVRLPDQPSSASERSDQIDRAYEEYCNRLESGDEVDADAFCARYPAFQTSLRRLVQAHRNLEENPELLRELSARWPEPGESFMGYRLLSELGRGAFARVFLAQELAVGGRLVAVKLSLHDDNEAETLGRLHHPNVVPIFSTQYDAGTGFSVVCMPFLGGTTLSHVIDHAGLTQPRSARGNVLLDAAHDPRWPGENAASPHAALSRGSYVDGALYVVERLAAALAYVHAQGIVHRDLKPSNVLFCPNGVPVLLDFNLALDREVNDYRLGGTLPYMPPEQLQTIDHRKAYRAACADARTDLYGLGVILYELLAGAHPYGPVPAKLSTFAARDWLLDQQKKGPRPIQQLNPDVDARLAEFAVRCISSDLKKRPATADEMLAELRRFLSPGVRARRWAKANWKSLTAASVLALVPTVAGAHYLATLPPAAVRNAEAGDEYANRGKLTEAVKAYSASLEANDDQPAVHFSRGRAYLQLCKWDAAAKDFAKADQTDGKTAACAAFCYAAAGDHKHAKRCTEEAIRLGVQTAAVLNNQSYSFLMSGNYQDAMIYAERALTIQAGLPDALLNRGMANWKLANEGMAKAAQAARKSDEAAAREFRVEALTFGRQALSDIQTALAGGAVSADTCYKAAGFGAQLLRASNDPVDRQIDGLVLDLTRKAIERGRSRQELEHCPLVGDWAKRLPAEIGVVPAPRIYVVEGLIDPLAPGFEPKPIN